VTAAWFAEHVGVPFRPGPVGLVLVECDRCASHVTLCGNPLALAGYYGTADAEADIYFTPQTMPVVIAGWPGEWIGRPEMVAAKALAGVR
jgi:hypothetical protein